MDYECGCFPQFPGKILVLKYWLKYSWPIKLKNFLNCNILWRKGVMKLIFWIWININIFYKLILRFLVGVVRHVQITNQIEEFFEIQHHKKKLIDCFIYTCKKTFFKNFSVLDKVAWKCPKCPGWKICNFLRTVCPVALLFWMCTDLWENSE